MVQRLRELNAFQCAVLIAGLSVLTIAGAWIFQMAGYLPCELCLKQRLAYYYGIPLAVLLVFMVQGTRYQSLVGPSFVALALIFAVYSVFGVYHSGVDWGFCPGPSECSGAATSAAKVGDFLKQLETVKVVRCDAVAIRILGLSLAGWNAVICAAISYLGFMGARQTLSLQKA